MLPVGSHPLYEDVNWNNWYYCGKAEHPGHPLYEDVNWNISGKEYVVKGVLVILYMRMWIEITS